jgi:ERF superfamily
MNSTLDVRDSYLCVMVTRRGARTKNSQRSSVRQWYLIREASEAEAPVLNGRPVTCTDRDAGLYIDEEGTSYRLAGGGQTKPLYIEIVPVEGAPGGQLEAGTNGALMAGRERQGSGLQVTGRRRRKKEEGQSATKDALLSDEQPSGRELNLREKFAEVRRRLGYVQKRGHNERHNYSYVMAADLAGSVGDILAELGVIVIPQLQSISTEPPRSSSERIARIVMNYRFVDARSGEELTVRVAGEGADAGDKAPYKAMTGALKYALLQSFLLATGDDPEDERADSRAALGSELVITPEHMSELQRLIEVTGTELERVLAYYRISALSEMTEGSYHRALDVLNRKLAKQTSQENGGHAQN